MNQPRRSAHAAAPTARARAAGIADVPARITSSRSPASGAGQLGPGAALWESRLEKSSQHHQPVAGLQQHQSGVTAD